MMSLPQGMSPSLIVHSPSRTASSCETTFYFYRGSPPRDGLSWVTCKNKLFHMMHSHSALIVFRTFMFSVSVSYIVRSY